MTKKIKKQTEPKDPDLAQNVTELQAGWRRTQADFENYKTRVDREKPLWEDSGKIKVLEEFLPILDNLTLAVAHLPQDRINDHWAQGIVLIANQIDERLSELGIEKIAPRPGETFDHNLHEAVSMVSDKNFKSNSIFELKSAGYRLGERIIRAAKVDVAS